FGGRRPAPGTCPLRSARDPAHPRRRRTMTCGTRGTMHGCLQPVLHCAMLGTLHGGLRMAVRVIKKYPNRRLYDTEISSYITIEDVRQLVVDGEEFEVRDARS